MPRPTAATAPADKNNSSPTSSVEEDSEETGEEQYSSSDVEGGAAGDSLLFGSLRTRLRWDAKDLHLDVRQYVQNRRKLEVKYKGRLNTHTGGYTYTAQVQRIMSQNTPSLARIIAAERGAVLEGEDAIDDTQRFLPAGLKTLLFKDWTAAPGLRLTSQGQALALPALAPAAAAGDAAADADVAAVAGGSSSSNSGLRYCVTFRKQPQVLLRRGVWDSWLQAKGDVEFDGQQQALGFRGSLRLKVLRLNVTDKQDLQLSLGADYVSASGHSSSRGSSKGSVEAAAAAAGDGEEGGSGSSSNAAWGTLTPYIKLSENSWAVRISRGALAFTYDI